jgi:hypothetical protein
MVKVHFTGWSTKYDEWIDVHSDRIIKQWVRGNPFQRNQRLDVKDEKNKWLEAHILEVVPGDYIKIHYKGWSSKFDEYIPISQVSHNLIDNKYAEVGLYSLAYGQAKYARERAQRDRERIHQQSIGYNH